MLSMWHCLRRRWVGKEYSRLFMIRVFIEVTSLVSTVFDSITYGVVHCLLDSNCWLGTSTSVRPSFWLLRVSTASTIGLMIGHGTPWGESSVAPYILVGGASPCPSTKCHSG